MATSHHSKLILGCIEDCIESYLYMVYFVEVVVVVVVVVVTTFSVLWPKKVIIYNLVVDTLIPKYVRLAHPSGTPFYSCTGFSHNHFSSICIHLHRSLHRDRKEYSSVCCDDTCCALY